MSRLLLVLLFSLPTVGCAGPGSGDESLGDLAHFHGYAGPSLTGAEQIELADGETVHRFGVRPGAGESATLPELDAGDRRFGFVLAGCAAETATLTAVDGELAAELEEPDNVDCAALSTYVAVFDVDEDDLPEGLDFISSTFGELVHFSAQEPAPPRLARTQRELGAGDDLDVLLEGAGGPALPRLPADARRFGFVMSGCQEAEPDLTVVEGKLTAEFPVPEVDVACEMAATYVAVFDVPADDLADELELPQL